MARKKKGKRKAGSTTQASSTAADSGTGATAAASGSSAVLSSAAEDFPHVRVKIFYVEESFNLAIDCPLDQTFAGLIPQAYRECIRVYNETIRPAVPVSQGMLQLMPSGPVGELSLREWCEAGYYLLCRFDPDIKGGLLWEKKLAEDRNWNASFDGLLKAEKERVTPSSAAVAPLAASTPFVVGTEICKGCLVLAERISEQTTRISEQATRISQQATRISELEQIIAPLQSVFAKHSKVLRRICLDAAKTKVVELVNVQPNNQPWRSYFKNLPQELISSIQPSLSEEALHILNLGASPLNWAAHNAPLLHEIASAVLDAPEYKSGWHELFQLGYGKTPWDALAWEESHSI